MAEEKPMGMGWFEYRYKKARRSIRRKFVEKIGHKLGMKQEPQIGMQGKSGAEIREELKPEFGLNSLLINALRTLEQQKWIPLQKLIWGEIVPLYRNMSFLTDSSRAQKDSMIQREVEIFTKGSNLVGIPDEERLGPGTKDKINYIKFQLGQERVFYDDPDSGLIEESLSVIGHEKVEGVEKAWNSLFNEWKRRARQSKNFKDIVGTVTELNNEIKESLSKIREREKQFDTDYVSVAVESARQLEGLRERLEDLRPQNVRFKHTYKVIAPSAKNRFYDPKSSNPVARQPMITLEEFMYLARKKFRRPDEVQAGYDENGYPLEVFQDTDGKWKVLEDRWWEEIASNEWQTKLITEEGEFEYPAGSGIVYQGKGAKGGKEIWKAKVENGILGRGPRKVPEEFVVDLDLLETAVYIFNELDAVRDDLRDGRWHFHSKTWLDYFLAAEGMSSILYPGDPGERELTAEEMKKCGPMPFKPRDKIIPKNNVAASFNPMDSKMYKECTPDSFLNEGEEAEVTRKYQMKINMGQYSYGIDSGIRKPTDLNPAYDRRALNSKVFDFHWGRLHYYGLKEEINQWAECPFPKISSRGLPKYVAHRLLMELYYSDAIRFGINKKGWDIGLRRPIIGGEFHKDLIGASDFISKYSPIGKAKEELAK